MLQLVLVSASMNGEFSLSDLAQIHTKSLTTTASLVNSPGDYMGYFAEMIFSHHNVILMEKLWKRKIVLSHYFCSSSACYCHQY